MKHVYKKSIRVNGHIKSVIEETFSEVRRRTGKKLSYGRIARAFWYSLGQNRDLGEKCLTLVCKNILIDADKNSGERCSAKKKKKKEKYHLKR